MRQIVMTVFLSQSRVYFDVPLAKWANYRHVRIWNYGDLDVHPN